MIRAALVVIHASAKTELAAIARLGKSFARLPKW
jgi:hypothetical protein